MPRLGVGMPITAGLSQEAVTTIDDFFFESFSAGEVHPMLTTSRTNLVTYSEDFSQWIADSVDTNVVTSPDGQTTADRINFSTTGALCRFITASGDPDDKTFTNSVFLKADTSTSVKIVILGSGGGLGFLSKTVTLTTEWQRFSVSQSFSGTGDNVRFRIESTEAGSIFAWGAQIEQDGFVSAYIPTSGSTVTVTTTLNDTSDVWDFDGTDITLEADPEDEGFWEEGNNLVLNHDYEDLGSEIIDNGTYDADTSWTKQTGWSIANGVASSVDSGSGEELSQSVGGEITSGKTYKVEYTISNHVTGGVKTFLSGGGAVQGATNTTNGTHIDFLTAPANNTTFKFTTASGGFTGDIDNVSVKQVDPNDRWSLETGWSIEDGKLKATSTDAEATQASIITPGNSYEITFTIDSIASGSVRVKAGTTAGSTRTSAGTYTQVLDVLYGADLVFDMVSSGTCVIDNVTVKEYAIQPQDV